MVHNLVRLGSVLRKERSISAQSWDGDAASSDPRNVYGVAVSRQESPFPIQDKRLRPHVEFALWIYWADEECEWLKNVLNLL